MGWPRFHPSSSQLNFIFSTQRSVQTLLSSQLFFVKIFVKWIKKTLMLEPAKHFIVVKKLKIVYSKSFWKAVFLLFRIWMKFGRAESKRSLKYVFAFCWENQLKSVVFCQQNCYASHCKSITCWGIFFIPHEKSAFTLVSLRWTMDGGRRMNLWRRRPFSPIRLSRICVLAQFTAEQFDISS